MTIFEYPFGSGGFIDEYIWQSLFRGSLTYGQRRVFFGMLDNVRSVDEFSEE